MTHPWQTVRDEEGLWSFSVYGERDADTVIILLPAMGVPARFYAPLLREWLDGDTAVIQADFITSRLRPEPGPHKGPNGYAALVEGCVQRIFETIDGGFPEASPVLVGHSLGGQVGLIGAGRYAPEIPVVLAASGTADHKAFPARQRWEGLAGTVAIGLVSRAMGYWPGAKAGFGGNQPAALMLDWARACRTGRFGARTGSFDYEPALGNYRGEVLAITMEGDTLAPQSATEALLAKTSAARVTRRVYSPARGNARPGPHFTWVADKPGIAGLVRILPWG